MSRVLLADHSPHAQRMGERILREEGFEVVTVTDGDTALLRLSDVDPALVLADISLPGRSGYELCDYVKNSGSHISVRVVLTAGPLASYDESEAGRVKADGFLRKPFEASALLAAAGPLADGEAKPEKKTTERSRVAIVDREHVRAAVILAMEASLARITETVTDEVFAALTAQNRLKHAR